MFSEFNHNGIKINLKPIENNKRDITCRKKTESSQAYIEYNLLTIANNEI